MSDSPRTDLPDLSGLQLKPSWVDELDRPDRFQEYRGQERPSHEERGRRPGREGRQGRGGPSSDRRPGGRPPGDRPPGDRPPGGDRRSRPPQQDRPGGRGPRREGGGEREARGPRGPGVRPGGGRGERRAPDKERRPDRPPLYESIDAEIIPNEEGVAAVARQIKMTGRSYQVFDLARLVLGGFDRFHVKFTLKPEAKTELVHCTLDNSYWLSRDESFRHFRNSHLFAEYYRKEQVEVDPPKGNFSVIAVCGLSGTVLGPPNFHAYQSRLTQLHAQRYSHTPLDWYKRKIRMVREEEALEKWRESLSSETHFTYLKGEEGGEPLVFKSFADAEKHFLETHGGEAFQSVPSCDIPGDTPAKQLSGALHAYLKRTVDYQKRFPMAVVKHLSPMLEKAGLKFFKLGKKTTYVSRSRPHPLNRESEVSAQILSIVEFVRLNPGRDLNWLVSTLVPNPSTSDKPEPTPEEVSVLKNLRWLIREGHVLEFANGQLQLAEVKAPPKPPPSGPTIKKGPVKGKKERTRKTDASSKPKAEAAAVQVGEAMKVPERKRRVRPSSRRRLEPSFSAPHETYHTRVLRRRLARQNPRRRERLLRSGGLPVAVRRALRREG